MTTPRHETEATPRRDAAAAPFHETEDTLHDPRIR